MSTTNTPSTASRTVHVGGELVVVERPLGVKASRALAIIRALSKRAPEIRSTIAEFTRTYEAENVTELDRAQARFQFPPRVLTDGVGEPIREPAELADGQPNPKAGELVWLPSVVDTISDEDWEASGGKLRLPRSPSGPEVALAALDVALESGEELVFDLLGLFVMSNEAALAAWRGEGLEAATRKKGQWLLETAYADELLEVAVAVVEVVDGSLRAKMAELGDRAGNALRRFGLSTPTPATPEPSSETETPDPSTSSSTSTDGPSSSTPSSSTDAPTATDGPPSTPSDAPPTSSSSSAASSSATPESARSSD